MPLPHKREILVVCSRPSSVLPLISHITSSPHTPSGLRLGDQELLQRPPAWSCAHHPMPRGEHREHRHVQGVQGRGLPRQQPHGAGLPPQLPIEPCLRERHQSALRQPVQLLAGYLVRGARTAVPAGKEGGFGCHCFRGALGKLFFHHENPPSSPNDSLAYASGQTRLTFPHPPLTPISGEAGQHHLPGLPGRGLLLRAHGGDRLPE